MMATAQRLKEHYLTCVVCSDIFTSPATLECEHTFCGECLVKFTNTKPDAIRAKSLLCPYCAHLTKVPQPEKPIEEWASQMKPSRLIQGLLDDFGPGATDTSSCSVCKDEGKTTPAISWCAICEASFCEDCLAHHRRMPSSRNHDVYDLTGNIRTTKKRKAVCTTHSEELKLFCKDCKKVICHICCSIEHRKCEDVVTIATVLPDMKSVLDEKKQQLLAEIQESKNDVREKNARIDKLQQSASAAKTEIKAARQKVVDVVVEMEKQLLAEVDDVTEKELDQLKADVKHADMAEQMNQQQYELLDQALVAQSEVDVCEMCRSCGSGAREVTGDSGTDTATLNGISFGHNVDELTKSLQQTKLGHIDADCGGQTDHELIKLSHVNVDCGDQIDLEKPLVVHDILDIKTPEDTVTPDAVDVVVMNIRNVKTVVVTDYKNNRVKSFYSQNNQPRHSQVKLDGPPWSVTKLQHNKVAVTIFGVRRILVFELTPDLVQLPSIPIIKDYSSAIAALSTTTLVAGSRRPSSIDILDMSGTVLKSITSDSLKTGQTLIQHPYGLCITPTGNILSNDYDSKCVLCMTRDGDVIFVYTPADKQAIRIPRGIATTITGDILVVYEGSDKVTQLSSSGQFVRDVLTSREIRSPCGICMDDDGLLYVTQRTRKINIFRTK